MNLDTAVRFERLKGLLPEMPPIPYLDGQMRIELQRLNRNITLLWARLEQFEGKLTEEPHYLSDGIKNLAHRVSDIASRVGTLEDYTERRGR